ncbi:MAG: DUF234 domain-containing protein, partial [Parabacteroides sp.]|nr:DUF234 domain-containing protein [Parabacteroides sp.]
KEVFGYLMELSQNRHFTLIIDEFQEFRNINSSIYSEMQNIWDANKNRSQLNLILCGSVYSLMKQIFENSREPLFGRATARIQVRSFYLFTGGVAKYVELLADAKAFTLESIVNEVFSENSLFLDEGYFSILSLIALSKTSRPEIESVLNMNIGGFLDKLENEYGLITKVRPILSKPAGKNVKYRLNDNFLNFWFRFIYKYSGAVETESFDYLKSIVNRDYTTYSGQILERYFREKIMKEENLSAIGSYWESGNQNEIDIVAINEYEKTAIIAEVKRQKDKVSLEILREKARNLVNKELAEYKIEYRALSIEDM